MGRVVKYLLWLVGGFVTLFVVAAVAVYLFFDPNDFREDIAKSVKNQTGRDLVIEGDIALDLFPWLAVEVGRASLGDAPGFGDEPMASFEKARFSVRLLPAIFSQEIVVGAADIESLILNLKVNRRGVSNWSDLVPEEGGSEDEVAAEPGGAIDINSIDVISASIRYSDEQADESIVLDDVNLNVGRLKGDGSPVPFSAGLKFDVQPAGFSGVLQLETVVSFDTDDQTLLFDGFQIEGQVEGVASIPTQMSIETDAINISVAEYQIAVEPLDINMLDMHILADVEPFSYEDRVTPVAKIAVDAFSPRTLMQLFDVAPPVTADPVALSRVILDATAKLTTSAIEMTDVSIKLDDTSFTGSLSVPRVDTGSYQFDLVGDSIQLARYMEPASDEEVASESDVVPTEIPVDLIRPLNARGKFRLTEAALGNIIFENIEVGLNSNNGKMRIFPISSQLFGGSYSGDVRLDVSSATPNLSMNEKIEGVDLGRLAQAMFEQDNVVGTIEGAFNLSGSGNDTAAIQRDLSGNMSMTLTDGSYTGTDVWFEIRRARALLKGEAAPEPTLPAKTDFSTVSMTGVVNDGVMNSDDFFAELPFMRLTGGGQLDIPSTEIDYGLSARILERPEFVAEATPEEIEELTEVVIPLKITGRVASPSIAPDLEKLLQQRVEEEIKDQLKDKLKGLFD
jgi:AsmA protein